MYFSVHFFVYKDMGDVLLISHLLKPNLSNYSSELMVLVKDFYYAAEKLGYFILYYCSLPYYLLLYSIKKNCEFLLFVQQSFLISLPKQVTFMKFCYKCHFKQIISMKDRVGSYFGASC